VIEKGIIGMSHLSLQIQVVPRETHLEELKPNGRSKMELGLRELKSYFGCKLHDAKDEDSGSIQRIEVTTATVHDRSDQKELSSLC
jgi:hypothetical protein